MVELSWGFGDGKAFVVNDGIEGIETLVSGIGEFIVAELRE